MEANEDKKLRSANWEHEETLVLLNHLLSHKKDFMLERKHETIYEMVSDQMKTSNYNRSAREIKLKVKNLRFFYKRLQQLGGNQSDWPYYSLVEKVFYTSKPSDSFQASCNGDVNNTIIEKNETKCSSNKKKPYHKEKRKEASKAINYLRENLDKTSLFERVLNDIKTLYDNCKQQQEQIREEQKLIRLQQQQILDQLSTTNQKLDMLFETVTWDRSKEVAKELNHGHMILKKLSEWTETEEDSDSVEDREMQLDCT